MNEIKLEITLRTAICAARHIVAAHKSARRQQPVEWAAVCVECSELQACRLPNAVIDWIETLRPISEATGIYPQLCGYDGPTDD